MINIIVSTINQRFEKVTIIELMIPSISDKQRPILITIIPKPFLPHYLFFQILWERKSTLAIKLTSQNLD